MANRRTTNWFPLLVLIGLVIITVLVFSGPPSSNTDQTGPAQVSIRGSDSRVLIPVAVEKLSLGTGMLKPGDSIILIVSIPVDGSPPLQYDFSHIAVYELLGISGPVSLYQRADIKTIVLEVHKDRAAEIQSVISAKDAEITYQVVEGYPAETPNPPAPDGFVQLPIPLDRFTAGTGPFSPGDYLNVTVHYIGTDGKTLVPVSFPNMKVTGLMSINGSIAPSNWNAIQNVILEVPADRAVELIQALAKEGRVIAYSRLSDAATPTPVPADTPIPPTPLSIPTLAADWSYIRLPIDGISNPGQFILDSPQDGRLVIVYQQVKDTFTTHANEQFCVKVVAFLDENGENARAVFEKKNSTQVLISLPIGDLARYGQALAGQVQLYLVPDIGCSTTPQ
jgi:hypothetical protein